MSNFSYAVLVETSIVPKHLLALFFSLLAVVTPTDSPKLVCNNVIDVLVEFFALSLCFFNMHK